MKHLFTLAATLALSVGTTEAFAQSSTQAANEAAAAQAAAPTTADITNADAQAQYQTDLAAYGQSLRANHHEAVRDQVHYEHQRAAYADAMAAWRQQVYACRHGSNRACNAPTPNPADFY
jgi:hypothetical protein